MRTVYLVTLWSNGEPGKQWKTLRRPTTLPEGTGVIFRDMASRLSVQLIGSISVEEYEFGQLAREEREAVRKGAEGDVDNNSESIL
jgi:hypothetical protein